MRISPTTSLLVRDHLRGRTLAPPCAMRSSREPTFRDSLLLPLLFGAAAIAGAEVARRMFRQSQLFVPSRKPTISWDPRDYGIPEGVVEEHWIATPDGERLHAWYCRAPNPVASGIFCHGNTGNLTLDAYVIPHLLGAGLSILFFDYRGFGRSSGRRPSIDGVIADAASAAAFHDRIRPRELPSVLYGYSLGGAIAAQVVRRHRFDAMILQSTFTSLTALTRVLYPRLPLHLLAGNLFNTIRVVRELELPLLVLHGTKDEVSPCSMAHELFGACPHPRKRIHCVEGALHKNIFTTDSDSIVWAISQFVAELHAPELQQAL